MKFSSHLTQEKKGAPITLVWTVTWRPMGRSRLIIAEGKTVKQAAENAFKVLKEQAA